jgi:streptogramin lyase
MAAQAHAVTFSSWTLQDSVGGQPQSISVNGSSPNVWFGEYETYAGVGFVTPAAAPPTGLTERLDDPAFNCIPCGGNGFVTGSAIGPDGRAWFAQGYMNRIGRIGPTGAAIVFDMPTSGSHPTDVTVGGDGAIWFEEENANKVARVATSATQTSDVTEFTDSALSASTGVTGLTTGPDGALYFSEGATIARMATNGTITRYPVLGAGVSADQIAWGPDTNGNTNWIWFTRRSADGYGHLDPSNGSVQTFPMPSGASGAHDLAPGPDGHVYITANSSEHIVRVTPGQEAQAEKFATAPIVNPYAIVAGPDGNIWFTEDTNPGHIVRLNILAPTAASLAATSVTATGATLNASVNSHGSTDTNYSFSYATNPALTGATSTAPGGATQDEAAHTVNTAVGGLTTGTTYYYKAVATNSNGSASGDVRSFTPGSPTPNAPVLLSAPQISGTPQVGSTLVCSTGTWTNDPTVYTYQWSRGGQPIGGASISDYTLADADADQAITCAVTAANAGGSASASSAGVTPTALAPSNVTPPDLGGFPRAGEQAHCDPGTWAHSPTSFDYAWELDGNQVATGQNYTPGDDATGHALVCRVVAKNSGGSGTATSQPLAVDVRAPKNVTPPKLVGTVKAYETVTCNHGAWSPTPISYFYTWLLDGKEIVVDDNASEYTPARSDVGHRLSCTVVASSGGFSVGTATSPAVVVATGRPLAQNRPWFYGTLKVGQTLTCVAPSFDDATSKGYQWYRWNQKIPGATSTKYKVTADDSGAPLACQVIATGPGGTSQTLSEQKWIEIFVRNMRIKGIEVTQGIQAVSCTGCVGTLPSRDQSNLKAAGVTNYQGVRMAAGHWLVVRVWADYTRDAFGNDPLEGVTARLEVQDGANHELGTYTPDHSPATIPEAHAGDGLSVSLAERADVTSSFDFLIPWQTTNHKTLHFRATLGRIPGKGPWQCDGCGANQFILNRVPFVKTSDTPIRPYPIAVSGARTSQDENAVFGTTQIVFPTNVQYNAYAAPIEVSSILNNPKVKATDKSTTIAAAVAKRAGDDKVTRDQMAIGVYVNGTANVGALSLSGRRIHEASGPPISIVQDAGRPLTSVMHEIGHGHGLVHADTAPHADGSADCGGDSKNTQKTAKPPGTQTGESWPPDNQGRIQGAALDRRNWDIYKTGSVPRAFSEGFPAKTNLYFDWMSYCANTDDSDAWISVRNWDRLLDYHAPAQDTPARAVTRQVSDPVRVIAVVGADGDGSIFDVAPGEVATGSRQTGSPFAIELRDAAGNPLPGGTTTTTVVHVDHAAPGMLVEATLPLSPAAKSIVMTNDGTPLATRARSAHPPTAKVTAPGGGARVGAGKSVAVRWTASDADGDALTSTVDYSPDGGRHWHVIADGISGSSTTIASSLLSGSRDARVRVRVSDGFDMATSVSKRFSAVGRPPRVEITGGVPGGKARADDVLQLEGAAFDDAGRPLTGRRLTWFAGRQRLGRGARLAVRGLRAGATRIRLVARDAQGRTGQASFALKVAAVQPEFLTYVAPIKLAKTARKVTLTLSTTVPANLKIGGKRFAVGRSERKITVRFKPGKGRLILPYVLRAGAKTARGSLQFKRG